MGISLQDTVYSNNTNMNVTVHLLLEYEGHNIYSSSGDIAGYNFLVIYSTNINGHNIFSTNRNISGHNIYSTSMNGNNISSKHRSGHNIYS